MKNSVFVSLFVIIMVFVGGFFLYYSQKNIPAPSVPIQNSINNSTLPPSSTTSSAENQSASAPSDFSTTNQITLSVNQPVNNTVVKIPSITVAGKTLPGAEVAINDKDIKADANGNFSTTITLDEGENTIVVMANDASGNSAEKDITVTYDTGNAY